MIDKIKKGLVGKIISGLSSVTLLAFVLLLSLYLFPRLVIATIVILTLIGLCRFLPKYRQIA